MKLLPIGLLLACGVGAMAFTIPDAPCDPGNAGLSLPEGFCATLFAEVPGARHASVAPNGDLYVAIRGRSGGMVALRDTDGDGRADQTIPTRAGSATGIVVTDDGVFLGHNDRITRYPWSSAQLGPAGQPADVVTGLPDGGHGATTMAIDADGAMYVDHGSRSNSCQSGSGTAPGMDPCPELPGRAGVWRYDARTTGQTPADGTRWATGLRNAMALAIEPTTGLLYTAIHGRDRLHQSWGYSAEEGAEMPAEEFGPVLEGADYGWPYCFHHTIDDRKVLAPEYGGDGKIQGRCAEMTQPAIAFPGHWAPMAMAFYPGQQFGADYQGGAFIAFHGSWNRAPLPQAGFRVVFVEFANGQPTGSYRTFATGSESETGLRPSGVAVAPDGALFITSDRTGEVWRVTRSH